MSQLYDINQIKSPDEWSEKKFLKPNLKIGKIPVSIEWYSDGTRKVVIVENGWSDHTLEEIDRHGKGIREEICAKLREEIDQPKKK
jgi:hypothetical protein